MAAKPPAARQCHPLLYKTTTFAFHKVIIIVKDVVYAV